jgi:hypothetical protein
MTEPARYAVYLFPSALESFGDAVKPYLTDGPFGIHVRCTRIDTGGALFQMFVSAPDPAGNLVEYEIMIPIGMVRLVLSTYDEPEFGFT